MEHIPNDSIVIKEDLLGVCSFTNQSQETFMAI